MEVYLGVSEEKLAALYDRDLRIVREANATQTEHVCENILSGDSRARSTDPRVARPTLTFKLPTAKDFD
jgi:hypothetical protein